MTVNVSIKRRDVSRLPFRDRFLVIVVDAPSFDPAPDLPLQTAIGAFLNSTSRSNQKEFRLQAAYKPVDAEAFADAEPPSTPTAASPSAGSTPGPKAGGKTTFYNSLSAQSDDSPTQAKSSWDVAAIVFFVGLLCGMLLEEYGQYGLSQRVQALTNMFIDETGADAA